MRDIETIETELIYADLEQAERRLERVVRQARGGDKHAIAEQKWLEQVVVALQEGKPVRTVPVPDDAPDAQALLGSLTSKPVLFVANVDEGESEVPAAIAAYAAAQGARAVAVSARLEAELGELERGGGRGDACGPGARGVGPADGRTWRLCTARPDRVLHRRRGQAGQTWHLRRGLTAWHAAGQIHSDIQKGFVRAEVVSWDHWCEYGGYTGARENAALRLEGRDYVIRTVT